MLEDKVYITARGTCKITAPSACSS